MNYIIETSPRQTPSTTSTSRHVSPEYFLIDRAAIRYQLSELDYPPPFSSFSLLEYFLQFLAKVIE